LKIYYELKYHYNLEYEANSVFTSVEIPILCSSFPYECRSQNIKHDGHDTSVHGNPQKCTCKDCLRTFYAHSSIFFFKNLIPLIGNTLNKFFNNDIINLKQNSKFFNCSNSYTATITKEIMMTVNDSTEVKLT